MTPLEEVARAICEETAHAHSEFILERFYWTRISRAAIKALIDNVSPDMAKVGALSGDFDDIICPDEEIERRMAVLIFQAMLTAALNEEDK